MPSRTKEKGWLKRGFRCAGRSARLHDALYNYLQDGGDEDTSPYVLVGTNGKVIPVTKEMADRIKK